jgi:hypothetical protein
MERDLVRATGSSVTPVGLAEAFLFADPSPWRRVVGVGLEDDERLEDTIEFFVHDLEGSLHFVE